ncbi:MAG TPA: hypothetical protein VHW43_12915 [Puia sp.]|nr:hypothetical protein [Puia sp.]
MNNERIAHLFNIFLWIMYPLITVLFTIGAVKMTKDAMKELREREELKSKGKES